MKKPSSTVGNRILHCAERVFLTHGYSAATMREIARLSGVTVSNIYNYFAGKDEMFLLLTAPAISNLNSLLSRHHGIHGHDVSEMHRDAYCNEMIDEYMQLLFHNRSALKLLLLKATGSSLQYFKEEFVCRATGVCSQWLREMERRHPELNTCVPEMFVHLNNVWLFDVIEELVAHDVPEPEAREVIRHYIRFEVLGWRELFGSRPPAVPAVDT